MRQAVQFPVVAGVYVINGPAGVYVGQAVDCYRRNSQIMKLGLPWGIVRELPAGASLPERMRAERQVADAWSARGFAIVSLNTTAAYSEMHRGRKISSEHRQKLSEGWQAAIKRPEVKARLASRIGTPHTAATKEKISIASKGRVRTPEHCAKISAARKAYWADQPREQRQRFAKSGNAVRHSRKRGEL